MFRQMSVPTAKPVSVPTTPIAAPVMRKTRMTAPWVAPMVRMIPMSPPLSFTSMIKPDTMLSAATRTISVRIRNITLRSTCSALEGSIALTPIGDEDRALCGGGELRAETVHEVGVIGVDLDRGHIASAAEIGLGFRQRHVDEGGIVFRHSDLEHRRNLVRLDA